MCCSGPGARHGGAGRPRRTGRAAAVRVPAVDVVAVAVAVGACAVGLDQQVSAPGFDPGVLITGERDELAP